MPVCRILPLVRAYMSFPAGAARMRYGRFLALSALGGVPWIVFWGVLGRALGSNYHSVENNLHYVDIAARRADRRGRSSTSSYRRYRRRALAA